MNDVRVTNCAASSLTNLLRILDLRKRSVELARRRLSSQLIRSRLLISFLLSFLASTSLSLFLSSRVCYVQRNSQRCCSHFPRSVYRITDLLFRRNTFCRKRFCEFRLVLSWWPCMSESTIAANYITRLIILNV